MPRRGITAVAGTSATRAGPPPWASLASTLPGRRPAAAGRPPPSRGPRCRAGSLRDLHLGGGLGGHGLVKRHLQLLQFLLGHPAGIRESVRVGPPAIVSLPLNRAANLRRTRCQKKCTRPADPPLPAATIPCRNLTLCWHFWWVVDIPAGAGTGAVWLSPLFGGVSRHRQNGFQEPPPALSGNGGRRATAIRCFPRGRKGFPGSVNPFHHSSGRGPYCRRYRRPATAGSGRVGSGCSPRTTRRWPTNWR